MLDVGCVTCNYRISEGSKTALSGNYTEILKILNTLLKYKTCFYVFKFQNLCFTTMMLHPLGLLEFPILNTFLNSQLHKTFWLMGKSHIPSLNDGVKLSGVGLFIMSQQGGSPRTYLQRKLSHQPKCQTP